MEKTNSFFVGSEKTTATLFTRGCHSILVNMRIFFFVLARFCAGSKRVEMNSGFSLSRRLLRPINTYAQNSKWVWLSAICIFGMENASRTASLSSFLGFRCCSFARRCEIRVTNPNVLPCNHGKYCIERVSFVSPIHV